MPATKSRNTNHGTCALVMAGLPSACIAAAICALKTMPNTTKSTTFRTTPAIRPPISTFCMLIFPIVVPPPKERKASDRSTPAAATVGSSTGIVKSQHVQHRQQPPHAIGNDGHTVRHNPFVPIDYQIEVVRPGRQLQRRFPDVVAESAQRRLSPAVPAARNRDGVRSGHSEAHDGAVAAMLGDQRPEQWSGGGGGRRVRGRRRERAAHREDSDGAGPKPGAGETLKWVAEVITSRCLDGDRRRQEVLQRNARRSTRGGGPAHPSAQPQ